MREILLTLCALALTTSMQAQTLKTRPLVGVLQSNPITSVPVAKATQTPRRAALASNQRIMGPYTSDNYDSRIGLGLPSYPGTYPVAAYMTDFSEFDASSVVAIRYALTKACTVKSVFLLGRTSAGTDTIAYKAVGGSQTAGWHTVDLDSKVTFHASKYSAIYLGFEYVQTSSAYPLSAVNEGTACPLVIYGNLGNGTGWYNMGTDYGNLSVQAIMEGTFAANAARFSDSDEETVLSSGSVDGYLTVKNLGDSLKSIDYKISIDGKTSDVQHHEFSSPLTSSGGSLSLEVPFTAPAKAGKDTALVSIVKVNGVANEVSADPGVIALNVVSKAVEHHVLVEEFTGTGCGYCPRGHVGMKHMRADHGDDFVGIAIHAYNDDDPMYDLNAAIFQEIGGFTGAPSAAIDRLTIVDPYYDAPTYFPAIQAMLPTAGLTVSGTWNADSTAINVTTSVEGVMDNKYELTYALIADSLTAPNAKLGTLWKQHNYYYSDAASEWDATDDPDFAAFCKGGSLATSTVAMAYNDVLVASSYSVTSDNKISNDGGTVDVKDGQTTQTTYTLSMPTDTRKTITDNEITDESNPIPAALHKDKVAVIAILIDAETGKVANAAKCTTILSQTDGIRTAEQTKTNTVVARYNAAGQRVSAATHGLVIEKLADGTTRKVIR